MRTSSLSLGLFSLLVIAGACAKTNDANADSAAAMAAMPSAVSADSATAMGGAVVRVTTDAKNGTHLADGAGRSLYMFEKDSKGTSTCDSLCADAWPPYLGPSATSGDTLVQAAMLSTITRTDGRAQVAYNDMPLYYFAKDAAPGDAKGQDITAFGGEWYLVAPSGQKAEPKGE